MVYSTIYIMDIEIITFTQLLINILLTFSYILIILNYIYIRYMMQYDVSKPNVLYFEKKMSMHKHTHFLTIAPICHLTYDTIPTQMGGTFFFLPIDKK